MKYLPSNTLAYFNASALVKPQHIGNIPAPNIAKVNLEYCKLNKEDWPEKLALEFYALNHAASLIRKHFTPSETLPPWAEAVMLRYQKALNEQGQRLFHYIVLIVAREMRHLKSQGPHFWSEMDKISPAATAFIKAGQSMDESSAPASFKKSPPACTIEQYLRAMSYGFHHGVHWGASYGGPAWGKIADTALHMVEGKTSMEMMIDTGYTLEHNTSLMFNKGMLYQQQSGYMVQILDVQASGQIPELLLDSKKYFSLASDWTDSLTPLLQPVQEAFGEFRGWIDWQKVIGVTKSSANIYQSYLKTQKKLHPDVPVKAKPVPTVTTPVPPMVNMNEVNDSFAADQEGPKFEFMPGQSVPIIQIEREA